MIRHFTLSNHSFQCVKNFQHPVSWIRQISFNYVESFWFVPMSRLSVDKNCRKKTMRTGWPRTRICRSFFWLLLVIACHSVMRTLYISSRFTKRYVHTELWKLAEKFSCLDSHELTVSGLVTLSLYLQWFLSLALRAVQFTSSVHCLSHMTECRPLGLEKSAASQGNTHIQTPPPMDLGRPRARKLLFWRRFGLTECNSGQ